MDIQQSIDKTPAWDIKIDYLSCVNFALQQSSVPFIRAIEVQNNSDFTYTSVKLKISTSPEFTATQYFEIDRIDANKSWSTTRCDIKLNFDYFANLSEKVNATLKLELFRNKNDGQEEVLAEKSLEVAALAANAWIGIHSMPELLAAFVTPNLNAIATLQRQMSALLAKSDLNDALSGYLTDKKHVLDMLQAAYNVLAQQQIAYSVVPDSFDGQKVRFAQKVFKERLANCLDFSLLFAGLLEQCGLNPLVIITKDHAFVGCHATNSTLPDAFVEDLQSIKKRVQLDEIFVFESTCALGANPSSFQYAEDTAKKILDGDDFEGALDIRQARNKKFMPLPLNPDDDGGFINEKYSFSNVTDKFDGKIKSRNIIEFEKGSTEIQSQNRLTRWQSKLLDLSKRNRLLNFCDNAKTIPLVLHDIGKLEDYLNAGKVLTIQPTNQMIDGSDQRDYVSLGQNIQQNPTLAYLEKELESSRIHSSYEKDKLHSKLLAIYRQAKTDTEEGGCNTLHIALGFLEWCEQDDINKKHYKAPILLIPMKLERKSVTEGFSLRIADEETIINITLLEKLIQDFEMIIPGLNADDLPKDDSGVDVEKILLLFQEAIKDTPGWEVKRDAWLGCFSFQKFLMYNELRNCTEELLKNPIVDHLLNHPTEQYDDKIKMVDPNQLDKEFKSNTIFCPLDADSSQISAVLSAERGKSFVLYGPPGTGKSQTITNIIAHCLASKEKVLFVSEKRAALEVVYHRLREVGLGPFCLELHSNKAGKNEVMRQFREILDYDSATLNNNWNRVSGQRDELRRSLKKYVETIHTKYSNGFTPYHALSFLIVHAEISLQIPKINFNVSNLSVDEICDIRNCAATLDCDSKTIETAHWRVLSYINPDSWTPSWKDEVQNSCKQTLSKIDKLSEASAKFGILLHLPKGAIQHLSIFDTVKLAQTITTSTLLPSGFYDNDWQKLSPILQKFVQDVQERDRLIEKLANFDFVKLVTTGKRDFNSPDSLKDKTRFYFSKNLAELNLSNGSTQLQKRLIKVLAKHAVISTKFTSAVNHTCFELGYACETFDEVIAVRLLALGRLIQKGPQIPESLLNANTPDFIAKAIAINDTGKRQEQLKKLLSNFKLTKIRNYNVAKWQARFIKKKNASTLLKKISCFFILKKMRRFMIDNSFEISSDNAADLLTLLVEYIEAYKKIRTIPMSFVQKFDHLWNYENSDWQQMRRALDFCKNINSTIESIVVKEAQEIIQEKVRELILPRGQQDEENKESFFGELEKTCADYQNSINEILSIFCENWHNEENSGKLADLFENAENNSDAIKNSIDHCEFIETIAAFANKSSAINDAIITWNLNSRLGNIWNTGKLNFIKWKIAYREIQEIETIINTPTFNNLFPNLRSEIGKVLSSNIDREQLIAASTTLIKDWQNYLPAAQKTKELLNATLDAEDVSSVKKVYDFIANNPEILRYWCKWCSTRNRAEKLHLEAFTAMIEHGNAVCSIKLATDIALYQKFAYEIYNSSEVLREMLGHTQDAKIHEFQQLDDLYIQLARKKIIANVSSVLPSKYARAKKTDTELGAFRREVQRQNRIIPVRKLLQKFSEIALRLKPCMLMSPLSVAQYLPPKNAEFDLVIFDEASQITPWDAIGVIARGKQLIVVGDPKQLPPTNFFQRQDSSDDTTPETDDVPDEQSILEECISARMDTMRLKWHYRSRHEALIAFSNHYYYEDSLLTFPAAYNKVFPFGVNFRFVKDGLYAGQTNQIEAEELVKFVVKTLQGPYFMKGLNSGKKKSLGIITFNLKQQELIDDLLDEARRKNPEIEPFFQSNYFEPVFVKNIENVQGDERDFILFSVCFAHQQGKDRISMNFGPLNRDGGERRLNVAVTRAKESIFVFSSIHHEDIDLSKTNKKGPDHLKCFLEYAEKGIEILGKQVTNAEIDHYDSIFEEEVARFLRDNRHEIHTQVGTSGYRIDLAVVSPKSPGKYVLGIECDGASYHSAATVRDRDKLRQRVLEGLGWTIIRVWSTDWWNSPIETKRNLLKYVEKAVESEKSSVEVKPVVSTSLEERPVKPENSSIKAKPVVFTSFEKSFVKPAKASVEVKPVVSTLFEERPVKPKKFSSEIKPVVSTLFEDLSIDEETTKNESSIDLVLASSCKFARLYPSLNYLNTEPIFHQLDQKNFYDPSFKILLRKQIKTILEKEAPIIESLLLKRMIRIWQFQRNTEKIYTIFKEALRQTYYSSFCQTNHSSFTENVYWLHRDDRNTYNQFRVSPSGTESIRKLEEIPVEELKNAMRFINSKYQRFNSEDALFTETGRLFGFLGITAQANKRYKAALRLWQKSGVKIDISINAQEIVHFPKVVPCKTS
ncbi:MAG: DUF3320 domain-containing protein [Lentisphaeria bacterium]